MGDTHLSGLEVAGVPTIGANGLPLTGSPGRYIFVQSARGQNAATNGQADNPVASIDFAVGMCTANRGDTIVVMQGHAETLSSAGAITCDVAGINIIGLGTGTDRPELTFSSSAAASVLITAANVQIANIVGIAGVDALTNPFHVQAAGCTIGSAQFGPVEWQDTSSGALQAVRVVLTTAAADNLRLNLKVVGLTSGGTAPVNVARLVGVNNGIIVLDTYGRATTAPIEFHTTACTNIEVYGYVYNGSATAPVVDTVTGSTWFARVNEGELGTTVQGGSGAVLTAIGGATLARKVVADASVLTTGASPVTLFTVTGDVLVKVFATVQTALASTLNNGTIALGVPGATSILIAATTVNGTNFVATHDWFDTGTAIGELVSGGALTGNVIAGGLDIIATIATNSITSGAITFYCFWQPLSPGASVVAA